MSKKKMYVIVLKQSFTNSQNRSKSMLDLENEIWEWLISFFIGLQSVKELAKENQHVPHN